MIFDVEITAGTLYMEIDPATPEESKKEVQARYNMLTATVFKSVVNLTDDFKNEESVLRLATPLNIYVIPVSYIAKLNGVSAPAEGFTTADIITSFKVNF